MAKLAYDNSNSSNLLTGCNVTNELATIDNRFSAIVGLVADGLTSDHSKRAYARAIADFQGWIAEAGRPGLSKATVNGYRAHLIAAGYSPATVNQRLSAIRRLAAEAADNGLLDGAAAEGIGRVKGVKAHGTRAGNWLSKDDAQRLLNAPDVGTLKGLRDRAILATMLGCGLRRAEVAALTFADIAQREGRWVVVDMVGKGGRVRTVPMPAWCKAAIDAWADASGHRDGRVFVEVNRGGHIAGQGITPQAVYNVVAEYSAAAGLTVAAHDLRRTFAKLSHKGGAAMEQIQLTLGHASIQTTERYLGVTQNLDMAPCDVIGLTLSGD
jgi:integrase/recombinase XerD